MVSTQAGRVLHGEGSGTDWFGEEAPKAEAGTDGNSTAQTHIHSSADKTSLELEQNRFLQSKPKVTTHGKRKEILDSADYAFTGSYYNTHRNIMNFDPIDLMPQYKGAPFLYITSSSYHADHETIHNSILLHCILFVNVIIILHSQSAF